MAGTLNLAMTQQFDLQGRILSGGLLYFFIAGTSTPQSAYKDVALTLPHTNPIVLDASGRVPMFYLADGSIKIRLTDKNGSVVIIAEDQLLVVGPSAGGGGGGASVDATQLLQTGDVVARYGTGTRTGFVRCNGNSIGQVSGTEGFGTQYQALFEYLWQFSNITLNTAKGASANADWIANRTLNLPDMRGTTIAGMDDMGASAAGRLTTAGLGVSGTVIGNVGGAETQALATANLPNHVHTGTSDSDGTHSHTTTVGNQSANHSHTLNTISNPGNHQHSAFIRDPQHGHGHTQSGGATQFMMNAGGAILAGGTLSPGNFQTFTIDAASTNVRVNSASGGAGTDDLTAGAGGHSHTLTLNNQDTDHNHTVTVNTTNSAHAHGFSTSGTTGATATAFSKTQRTMVLTFYMKL